MKVVIASPLYPPDIAEPAPYVKELARRLSERHAVTIVTYGRYPENVPGVGIIAIDKRSILPIRLLRFIIALWKAAKDADVLYAINGPSVELPLSITAPFVDSVIIFRIGDQLAHRRAHEKASLGFLERHALSVAKKIITTSPDNRPFISPFDERNSAAFESYEQSWAVHIKEIESAFTI